MELVVGNEKDGHFLYTDLILQNSQINQQNRILTGSLCRRPHIDNT